MRAVVTLMFDWLQRFAFEAPATVALGPELAALASGFAILVGDRMFITPAGERYLQNVNSGESHAVAVSIR